MRRFSLVSATTYENNVFIFKGDVRGYSKTGSVQSLLEIANTYFATNVTGVPEFPLPTIINMRVGNIFTT